MTLDKLRTATKVHTAGDRLGPRDVYLDGVLLQQVVSADIERGVVEVCDVPLRVVGDEVAKSTLHGRVVVVFK